MRQKLGLTQEGFAAVLGLSFVSVNKWENEASAPTGLSAVMLELLQNSLAATAPERVLASLRTCNGSPIDVVRTLTKLERR